MRDQSLRDSQVAQSNVQVLGTQPDVVEKYMAQAKAFVYALVRILLPWSRLKPAAPSDCLWSWGSFGNGAGYSPTPGHDWNRSIFWGANTSGLVEL